MTIKEIAKESGYGVGTVSRVLNGNPNVSEEAREKILAVVRAHNYQPNANARHLKLQARFGVAVIVKGSQNMLFAELLEKMQLLIERSGYVCMISYIDQDADEAEAALQICKERKPYGIVFLGSNLEQSSAKMGELDVPAIVVTTGASSWNLKHLSSISVDDRAAAACMIDALVEKGHTKIGLIGGDPNLSYPSLLRLSGCQGAFFRHGLTFDPKKQYAYSRFSMEGGYAAAVSLLEKYPEMTAIFAMSDMMAIGVICALYDHGKRVPADISVAGYDGITLSRYCHPKLTTVRQNIDRMAERGTEILLRSITEGTAAVHEIVPYELVMGNSVADLRRNNDG